MCMYTYTRIFRFFGGSLMLMWATALQSCVCRCVCMCWCNVIQAIALQSHIHTVHAHIISTRTHIPTHICINTADMHAYAYVHMQTNKHADRHSKFNIFIHANIHTWGHTFKIQHIHTCKDTHMNSYIHSILLLSIAYSRIILYIHTYTSIHTLTLPPPPTHTHTNTHTQCVTHTHTRGREDKSWKVRLSLLHCYRWHGGPCCPIWALSMFNRVQVDTFLVVYYTLLIKLLPLPDLWGGYD